MSRRMIVLLVAVPIVALVIADCSNSYNSPTQPPQQLVPQLTAVPSSASVSVGTSQNVLVSGGKPPYSIATGPSSIATATMTNADSAVATLVIVGVTVASVSTSVTVRDSLAAKTVSVPISVR